MKDAFKIKKGLNIAPVDPVSVVNPEAGDLIIDSSDDNKLKVFDEASSDWASVGSGGSSGNLMSDFEKLTPTVSNVVATVDTVTYLPIDDNNKSVKAVFSGSNGSIRYQVAAPADLEGTQGVVQLWIKTSVQNLQVIATRNGVQYAGPLTVNSSNKWRQYEIPVVFSDANYGFEIKANGSAAGDVFIDEAFVKVQSIVSTVDIAMTDWVSYTPTGSWTTNANYTGRYRRVGDTLEGFVRVNVTGAPTASALRFSLPSGLSIDTSKLTGMKQNFTPINGTGTIDHSGGGYKIYGLYYDTTSVAAAYQSTLAGGGALVTNTVPVTVSSGSVVELQFRVPIVGWSVETSTIVTQNTELTAQTANEFVANVSSTGVVSGENFDWINGNCTSTSPYTCTFNTGIFSAAPNCIAESDAGIGNDNVLCRASTTSTSSVAIKCDTFATSNINRAFKLNCTRSTDYRKHATIVGKFENINSSELVKVRAQGNNGATLTANVTNINWSETIDNYNAFNGTQFTPPKDGYYFFTGQILATTSPTMLIDMYVNGSGTRNVTDEAAANDRGGFSFMFYLLKNQVVSFRVNTNMTLSNNSGSHWLEITELPDTESIIKNLNDDDSKVVSDTTGNRVKVLNGLFSNATASVIACSSGTCASTGNNTGGAVATFVSTGKYQLDFPAGTWKPSTLVSCSYTCHQTSTQLVNVDDLLNTISLSNGSFTPNTIGCITATSSPARTNSAVSWQCIGEKP